MRRRRRYSNTGLYHIVIRGVNKQNIFLSDTDKEKFMSLLKKFSKRFQIRVHAYCLMDNHVHLLLEETKHNISSFIQLLASVYARFFNKKYDRIGHLYQDRFASEVIENNEYYSTVFRYILQNPLKSGITNDINYKWNSYAEFTKKHSFIYNKMAKEIFINHELMVKFVTAANEDDCLEISLRPSEKKDFFINKIKKLLNNQNPKLAPDLPKNELNKKLRLLKSSGISIRTISRITGIDTWIIYKA